MTNWLRHSTAGDLMGAERDGAHQMMVISSRLMGPNEQFILLRERAFKKSGKVSKKGRKGEK